MNHHNDKVFPFILNKTNVRGRLVRLSTSIQEICTQHNYPHLISHFLAEVAVLGVTIANCFKFEGFFTLQIRGNGPVPLMVIDITSEGEIRGCARFTPEALQELNSLPSQLTVPQLFGAGYLAFTIDPHSSQERYQGIVELTGSTLTECVNHFFRQSEQLDTALVTAVASDQGWHAYALMVQKLPTDTDALDQEAGKENWFRTLSLMATLKSKELSQKDLSPEDLLYRLFWDEEISMQETKSIIAKCRCTDDRVKNMLGSFSIQDRHELAQEGEITVNCEFCNKAYVFTEADFLNDETASEVPVEILEA